MKRSVLILFLITGTAACGSSGRPEPPRPAPFQQSQHGWTPIAIRDVPEPQVRAAITDLLRVVDSDFLWPRFTFEDHGVLLVIAGPSQPAIAYCVGICAPQSVDGAGTSRLWRTAAPITIEPDGYRFMPSASWNLRSDEDIVAVGFASREGAVVTALHEDFHLHYQSRQAVAYGDAIGPNTGAMSTATRSSLENTYSRAEPVLSELREECVALAGALRAGTADPSSARNALRRFVAVREIRRARPEAPSAEEDFWERQEGIPTNIERRAAAQFHFADPSAIAAAMAPQGCTDVANGSYFLVLGGLQAAVLDTFDDPSTWPHRVYPSNGAPASSLYVLIRTLYDQPEIEVAQ